MNKSIINSISLLRIAFGFLFLYFALFDFNILILIIIFIFTALCDILDGHLARKYGLSSNDGAKLDVICDFIFIFLSSLALVIIGLIPSWFLFVIVLKLIEFFMTSSSRSLTYDRFGHIVALMFYAFPLVAILINSKNITLILSICITICAVASSFLRIKNMREQ